MLYELIKILCFKTILILQVRIDDGVPLTWPYYIINKNKISRFNGMDVVENYFFNENSFRHFFIGSSEEILKEAHRNILEKNSKFNLVGTYIPPFSDVSEWKFDEIIQTIENCNANFIWVGVGSLKQEELMYRIQVVNPNLNMYSAGAAFDWVAGKTKRAPNLLIKFLDLNGFTGCWLNQLDYGKDILLIIHYFYIYSLDNC